MRKQEKQTLEVIREALRAYRGANITYRDLLGRVSSRAILPFRVYERGGIVFVQSYCWLAKDAVAFALPGILRIDLRTKVVQKVVYARIRDEHDMLCQGLAQGMHWVASVNLEEV